MSDAPRKRLVLWWIVQGYRTKLLRATPGSLVCSVYSIVTWDLCLKSHPKEKLLIDRLTRPGIGPTTSSPQVERPTNWGVATVPTSSLVSI